MDILLLVALKAPIITVTDDNFYYSYFSPALKKCGDTVFALSCRHSFIPPVILSVLIIR